MIAQRPALLDDPVGAAGLRQDHASRGCWPSAPSSHFEPLSAVFSGVADLRTRVRGRARSDATAGQGTLLFVDEIHRFNRAQQDGFLPYVEDGTVILVGATTENPSFELNAALLSRAQVFVLRRLDDAALETLLAAGREAEGRKLPLDADARSALRAMADGDGRYLLNMVEELFALPAQAAARGRGRRWPQPCSSARRSTTRPRKGTTT